MSIEILSRLPLGEYAALLSAAVPDVQGLALVSERGKLLNTHGDPDGVIAGFQGWSALPGVGEYAGDDGHLGLREKLRSAVGSPLGHVVLFIKCLPDERIARGTAAVRALAQVATCLMRDYQLGCDVQALTGELVERYEELNLVYKTSEGAVVPGHVSDALNRLVRNCREHLGVGRVVLLAFDKNRSHYAAAPGLADEPSPQLYTALRGCFSEWVTEKKSVLVINHLDDPVRAELCPELAEKLLLAPLIGDEGLVAGLFALINDQEAPNFCNSDRNLISVMADRAAEVLLANRDKLTGMIARAGFEYLLGGAINAAQAGQQNSAVLYLNIDQMHVINDTLGRQAGDDVIKQIAVLLRDELSESATVARLGGDEFGILRQDVDEQEAEDMAHRISELIGGSDYALGPGKMPVSVSIGVALVDEAAGSIDAALADAEVACSAARDEGRNNVRLYRPSDIRLAERHAQMQSIGRIQQALDGDQFVLYGQLIAPLHPRAEDAHVEVLLRMQDEDGKIQSPAHFIPAAERYDLMSEIDKWVLTHTLEMMASVPFAHLPHIVAINLSGQSLGNSRFLSFAMAQLEQYPQLRERLCFEVTETSAIASIDKAVRFMTKLKEKGCRFALDDFGAGLSSFAYLKNLPVDYLKIDGCFVKELLHDHASQSIVAAINHVGHSLGLATIAEFVENDEIRAKLRDLGVDFAQGYGVQIPLPFARHLAGAELVQAAGM